MKVNKRNIYNYVIPLSFVAVIASFALTQEIQHFIALLGIFSFGILHGSNDLFVVQNLSEDYKQNQFIKSLLTYLGVVLCFVVVFYLIPLVALVAFVLISAYHFGEQHFHHKIVNQSSVKATLFYFSYGLLVLFLLFIFNGDEVLSIIKDMTAYRIPDPLIPGVLLFALVSSCILFYSLSKTNRDLKDSAFANVLYLVLFSILFYLSDVVWGFAAYFVLWHSLPSLKDQVNSLYGEFHLQNFIKYFKKAFPYWLASIIGMCVVVWLFKDTKNFLSLLFAFIAAITFPHVFIMRKLFDRN